MYVCRWFVLCETVVLDQATNGLTMVNALNVVTARSFPAHHVRFAFATRLDLEGDAGGPVSVRFVREKPEGDEVLIPVTGAEAPPRVQFFFNFPLGLRLIEVGTVTFRIDVREGEGEWYGVASQSLQVEAAGTEG
jgi:hypothetical protein